MLKNLIKTGFIYLDTHEVLKLDGDIKKIVHMGGGNKHGFPFGFSTGCIYYKKNYTGNIEYIRAYESF